MRESYLGSHLGVILVTTNLISLASKFLVVKYDPGINDQTLKVAFLDLDDEDATKNCQLPDFPIKLFNAVGGFTKNGPLICSGAESKSSYSKKCYIFKKEQKKFVEHSKISLEKEVTEASSIVSNDGQLWITGGYYWTNDYLKSTALITKEGKTNSTELKEHVYGHCVTRINARTAILTGGYFYENFFEKGNSKSTFLIDLERMEISDGPNLNKARLNHGCTSFKHMGNDVVVVAGGRMGNYDELHSWEFLDLSGNELSWQIAGPGRTLTFLIKCV